MRVNMYQNGGAGAQGLANPDGVATGPIVLTRDPTLPLEAVAKQYVDTAVTTLSASNIISGTLSPAFLPAYSGDATSAAGSATFTLASTGVTPGRYTKFTVDAKGRVTAGSNLVEADLPNMSWSDITLDKPNTLAGFGITDGLAVTGGTLTQNLIMSGAPTDPTHVATKGYLDSVIAAGAAVSTPTGNIVQMLLGSDKTGFLACNGASVSKTTYADLYAVVGDTYSVYQESGQPWRQQYTINTTQSGDITGWTTGTSLPSTLYSSQAVVTKNRVYLLGGATDGGYSSTVYTAPISSDGTLGTWTTGTSLPGAVGISQAIVTKNRVYLLGGGINGGAYSSAVYTAPINSDGTLGTWTTGTSLPGAVGFSQAVVTKNRVYLLGGVINGGYSSTVYTAPINSDGTLGTWATGTPLPDAVGISQAVVTKNRVYLLGGHNGTAVVSTVYTAPINSDGTLGTWTTGTSLPGTVRYSQAIVTLNRVYLLGGSINGTYSSTVYTAPISSDGTLGAWTTGTPLPGVVCISQAIVTKNRVYLLGGQNGTGYSSTVYTAPISGGLNDYSEHYGGDFTQLTYFYLPDLTTYDLPGINHYIKT